MCDGRKDGRLFSRIDTCGANPLSFVLFFLSTRNRKEGYLFERWEGQTDGQSGDYKLVWFFFGEHKLSMSKEKKSKIDWHAIIPEFYTHFLSHSSLPACSNHFYSIYNIVYQYTLPENIQHIKTVVNLGISSWHVNHYFWTLQKASETWWAKLKYNILFEIHIIFISTNSV